MAGQLDALTDTEVIELWSRYQSSPDGRIRDSLILHYSPLVKYVASRVAVGLPQNVEQADLVSYGMFGLIDAIDKFELGRGFKFETYAISRIKGAILDELRSIDWVPRSVRAKVRGIELSLLQRCGAHLASETDLNEAIEAGRLAVETAIAGETGKMVAFERSDVDGKYVCEMTLIPLESVANLEKKVPREWINEAGNNVTKEFIDYAQNDFAIKCLE